MPPLQPLVQEDLVDPTALHRDALLFVEVGFQPIQRPAAKGQLQALRVGQGRGDHLSPLRGGVGLRPARAGAIVQTVQSLLVEAMDPRVDGGPTDAEVLSNLAGPSPVGEGQEDPGPLDVARLGGP
jgi:hypothetical protein